MKKLKYKLQNRFAALPSHKRKNIILGTVATVLVGCLFIFYQSQENTGLQQKREQENRKRDFVLPSVDMAKESWTEQGQRKLSEQDRRIRDLEDKLKNMEMRQAQQGSPSSAAAAPGSAAEREAKLLQDFKKLGVTTTEKGAELYPPSPVKPAVPANPVPDQAPESPQGYGISTTPPQAQRPAAPTDPEKNQPIIDQRALEPPKSVMGVYHFSPPSKKEEPAPNATAPGSAPVSENFYTPTGAFFKTKLLTGLDAPAGPSSQSTPHPVLLRIQDLSWLPNELRQNVTGCFVMGESYGDLSTERAYIRGLNLSCVNKENEYVLDEEIQGYLADSDGKLGLRGRVVSKQGSFLSLALTANFIEAIAKGFETSVNTTVVTTGGAVTTNEVDGFGDGFKQGMASGFSKTADKLSDFYLKAAERLYPIIEIGSNRSATFVITRGKRFSFDKQIIHGRTNAAKVDGQL